MTAEVAAAFAEYDSWAARWNEAWERLDPSLRRSGGWVTPWMGDDSRDGNPIFSAWSKKQRRAIRVVQSDDPGLYVYLDRCGEPGAEVRELVIACGLDADAITTFEEVVGEWLSGSVTARAARHPGPIGSDDWAVRAA